MKYKYECIEKTQQKKSKARRTFNILLSIMGTRERKRKKVLITTMNRVESMGSIADTLDSYDNVMSFADDNFSFAYSTDGIDNDNVGGYDDDDNSFQNSKGLDYAESKCGSNNSTDENDTTYTTRCEVNNLVTTDTRYVKQLRRIIKITIILASIGTFYLILSNNRSKEDDNFHNAYNTYTTLIINDFHSIFEQRLNAMISLKSMIESYATDIQNQQQQLQQQSWPYITVPSIQQRTSTVMNSTGSLFFTYGPFVSDSDIFTWGQYSIQQQQQTDTISTISTTILPSTTTTTTYNQSIHYYNNNNDMIIDAGPGPYLPIWQTIPVAAQQYITNYNLLKHPYDANDVELCNQSQSIIVSSIYTIDENDEQIYVKAINKMMTHSGDNTARTSSSPFVNGEPVSSIYLPVFDTTTSTTTTNPVTRTTVGIASFFIQWKTYLQSSSSIYTTSNPTIYCIIQSECENSSYTFTIKDRKVQFSSVSDNVYEKRFEYLKKSSILQLDSDKYTNFSDGSIDGINVQYGSSSSCPVTFNLYPSHDFYTTYHTDEPIMIAVFVSAILCGILTLFIVYDRIAERRTQTIFQKAVQSSTVVSGLFPKNVLDKLTNNTTNHHHNNNNSHHHNNENDSSPGDSACDTNTLQGILNNGFDESIQSTIADLFPHTTVMFSDICGFTAWSSTREPVQVFVLLQAVYQEFDKLAKKRNVYKVETIGDSYVAVTGLPNPQPNHAVLMARFASDCLHTMIFIARELETKLGPDTGDLCMRFGLHSGPVTAGVLRGERARFQLFGDTVNTASRMESTGHNNMIQVSETTAAYLREAGKDHWLCPRLDPINAKGKGLLKTFWVNPHAFKHQPSDRGNKSVDTSPETAVTEGSSSFASSSVQSSEQPTPSSLMRKDGRVDWITEMLLERIKAVVAVRKTPYKSKKTITNQMVYYPEPGTNPLDEITESIALPQLHEVSSNLQNDPKTVVIDNKVMKELKLLAIAIASLYADNPFHNFDHACHVTQSVNKLLSRIVTPTYDVVESTVDNVASHMYQYTHGINADPITLLALVVSALIHDVDHRGVSNAQMGIEVPSMAAAYKNKSIAEQNSLDLSWRLLMSDNFTNLRNCIFETEVELKRFRQIIVNVVLATDIFDPDLNALRKKRWEKAFATTTTTTTTETTDPLESENMNNVRATIVIEHLIQASDVSHTMQHWHVYRKWNKKLFNEMVLAYRTGRMSANPTLFWYTGELSFFDNYIIPLSKKLQECQVFGVCSDEYLNYAIQNRAEWAARGQELVADMITELDKFLPPEPQND